MKHILQCHDWIGVRENWTKVGDLIRWRTRGTVLQTTGRGEIWRGGREVSHTDGIKWGHAAVVCANETEHMQSVALGRHSGVLAEETVAKEPCWRVTGHPFTSSVWEGRQPAQETQKLTRAVEGVGVELTRRQFGEPREQTPIQHLDPEERNSHLF